MAIVRLAVFSVATLAAEGRSIAELCKLLDVAEPAAWPPQFNDEGTRRWFAAQLEADPGAADWLGYYVLASISGIETLVGSAGYKGPPDADGAVEIGYSIVAAYHRLGLGTATVRRLVERALADARVGLVAAETPMANDASRGLLERCGFSLAGYRMDADEGELVRYALRRLAH